MAENPTVEADDQCTFADLGVHPDFVRALREQGITEPTPIQCKVIPPALRGEDVIGVAPTGTGKTLSYLIHVFQKRMQTLVVVPTRELAEQGKEMCTILGRERRIRSAFLTGGIPIDIQRTLLNRPGIGLVVGTPGRLNALLEKNFLSPDGIESLIIDEADRMFDMGFKPDIDKILERMPKKRQTMLFSATMQKDVSELAATVMRDDTLRIEVAPSGTAPKKIEQQLFLVEQMQQKFMVLERLLAEHAGSSFLVFCNTKVGASDLTEMLGDAGHAAMAFHKDCAHFQRKEALQGFKSGRCRILVATNIAERGIDVSNVDVVVVVYSVSDDPNEHIHRIGRTGRAGRSGRAITIATAKDQENIAKIEKLQGARIPRFSLPEEK